MEDLPRGTVTFLFTDIESSCRRWEDGAAEMALVLARHDEILIDAVRQFGGVVFKHLGDGICAAFGSATACLTAAVTAQGSLQAEPWPDGQSLAVRMGIHTGDVDPRQGDYFGPAVNRAARVMGTANGGQIVCSSTTAGLCRDVVLVDTGEHELRGIGVERLHLVAGTGYSSDDRPLRTDDADKTNVPPRLTSFIGRESELNELCAQLGSERMVTLVGVGGVGKTSLALAAARALDHLYRGGIWVCELAPVRNEGSVPAVVAETIGARAQPGMSLVDSIVDYLGERKVLIVLDNCEHVASAASRLVERLLEAPHTAVLATSRATLGVPGEHVRSVDPLDARTSGVELFADRARQRNDRFRLDGGNREVVEEICARLDGLPLAIELAAARVRALSPAAIAERLDDRFRLLRGGRSGARHETLLDTLRWSYDLLDASEAALFDRLSVFAGGFTLHAAEQICADSDLVDQLDIVDLLTALVDKSMVVAEQAADGDRYHLLETLRQYGMAQLEATGHHDELRKRHCNYFHLLALAQEHPIFSEAEVRVFRTIEADWDNLREAFSQALRDDDTDIAADIVSALAWYCAWTARVELFSGAEVLLGRPQIELHPRYITLCGLVAWAAFNRVELRRALEIAEKGLATGLSDTTGLCHLARMAAEVNLGDVEATTRAYRAWVTDAAQSPVGVQAHPENMMGLFVARMQASSLGQKYTRRGMELAVASRSRSALAYAHMCAGWALSVDNPDAAMASFNTSIELAETLSARHNMRSFSRRGLADLAAKHSAIDEALRVCRDALTVAIDHHHTVVVGQLLAPSATVLRRAENDAAAATLLGCLDAHGHQPGGEFERPQVDEPFWAEFQQGALLSMQQAAQLASDAIDQTLNRLARIAVSTNTRIGDPLSVDSPS